MSEYITAADVVNDVVVRHPETIAVFNTFGIDSCCGGAVSIAEAAERDGADTKALLDTLRATISGAGAGAR